jgi:hypothetical protein
MRAHSANNTHAQGVLDLTRWWGSIVSRAYYGGMTEKKLEQILPRWRVIVDTTPTAAS